MKLDYPLKCKTPLHLKSRGKHIGRWSRKKITKRVTTTVIACSDDTSLPPLFIFKTAKPGTPSKLSKSTYETKKSSLQSHSFYNGWVNKRVMENHFLLNWQISKGQNSLGWRLTSMKLLNITERKNKDKFKSPTKALIVEWALNTYKFY